jgi:hypothetical protein
MEVRWRKVPYNGLWLFMVADFLNPFECTDLPEGCITQEAIHGKTPVEGSGFVKIGLKGNPCCNLRKVCHGTKDEARAVVESTKLSK